GAAETERHDADASLVKLGARGDILVDWGGITLGLRNQRQIAKAHALAVAGTIDNEATDAACREIGNAVPVLQLLGDIEAIKEHHARRRSGTCGIRIRVYEQPRQARILVRHFARLDARPADYPRRLLEDLHRPRVDVLAAPGARVDETLAGLIIARRAQEACCRREPMPRSLLAAPAPFDPPAHAGPFLEPSLIIADVALQGAPDAVHFVDLDAGPGSGTEADKQPHGPAVIVRKIEEGRIVFAADHGDPS